ncbi:MAG TPA: EF-hand domain-containing protein [Steroidobacteraceae bacterium]|nr:EF-hand domain-containing protein [Steroidobacteraceae bacterium]
MITRFRIGTGAVALLAAIPLAAQAHPQKPRLDTNGDGSVDLAEMQAAKADFTVEQFNKADANGDGLLSRDELRQAHHRARFGRLDQDGNGSVSLAELQAAKPEVTAEKFATMDADGNGQVTPEEMRAMHKERHRRHAERQDKKPGEG